MKYSGKLNDKLDIEKALLKCHQGKIWAKAKSSPRSQFWDEYFNRDPNAMHGDLEDEPFLDFLVTNVFEWCGCNTGVDGRLLILYKIMQIFDDCHANRIDYKERERRLQEIWGTWGAGDILMDFFTNHSLFSHGGSNGGSWIDQDGHIVYTHLKAWHEKNKSEME